MLTCPLGLPVSSFVSDHLHAKSPAKGLLWYAIALWSSEGIVSDLSPYYNWVTTKQESLGKFTFNFWCCPTTLGQVSLVSLSPHVLEPTVVTYRHMFSLLFTGLFVTPVHIVCYTTRYLAPSCVPWSRDLTCISLGGYCVKAQPAEGTDNRARSLSQIVLRSPLSTPPFPCVPCCCSFAL